MENTLIKHKAAGQWERLTAALTGMFDHLSVFHLKRLDDRPLEEQSATPVPCRLQQV